MESFHVFTVNGRIFYTDISLNDRFEQYQVFRPIWSRLDCHSYFANCLPKRPRHEIDLRLNRFATAPIMWDANFHNGSSICPFFGESSAVSSDRREPVIYKPVANTKRKRHRHRRRTDAIKAPTNIRKAPTKAKKAPTKTKDASRKALTKEQLDEELDQYMMNIKLF